MRESFPNRVIREIDQEIEEVELLIDQVKVRDSSILAKRKKRLIKLKARAKKIGEINWSKKKRKGPRD